MTVDISYYLSKVPPLHAGKPNFMATLAFALQPFVDAQNFAQSLQTVFDVDTAIGVQLDATGLRAGITRDIDFPIPDLWFSFDDPARGADRGLWKDTNSQLTGLNKLDDDTYRRLIYAKIAANCWDGSLEGATNALQKFFSNTGCLVFCNDNQDMTMTFAVSQRIPTVIELSILDGGYLPLKPGGVAAIYLITTVDDAPLFGFDVENEYVSGFDVGAIGASPAFIVRQSIE
jgi:hypothetical protein